MTQSFQSIVSAVKAAAEIQDEDFDNFIKNTAFDITEERLTRDLDSFGLMQIAQTTVSIGDALITKPDDARVIKSLVYISAERRNPLYMRTDEYIAEYWPTRSDVGEPKYYANWDGGNILVAPTFAAEGILEMTFVIRPSVLASATQETNWFTQYAPNALFYGVMVEAARYMKNWGVVQMWETAYQNEISLLRNEVRRTRRDDQSSPESPQRENSFTGRPE